MLRLIEILDRAADAGADLVVLPETWTTGYDLPAARRLVHRSEAVLELLADAARSAGVAVVGSMVLPTPTGAANAAVMIDAKGDVSLRYAKSHLIDLYGEKSIFEPGRATPTVEIAGTRLGVAICYDLRFPELFRRMVDQGAEFFLVCSAWPYPRLEHWLMLNRVRALENEAFLVSANCVGVTRGKQFCGHSQVVDPWGAIVAASGDEETVVWADVDPSMAARVRDVFPPLRDRVL